MIAIATVSLLWLACAGFGAAALGPAGLLDGRARGERIAVSFAAGTGFFGWVVFFPGIAGWLTAPAVLVLCGAGVLCGVAARRHLLGPDDTPAEPPGRWTGLLIAALLVAVSMDALEAYAPPADADSLAYHFALPKQFALAGAIEFVPRVIDGAAPLLLHMSYATAYLLGGESALTLWTALTGWMAGGLLYGFARRYLARDWSLAAMLLFMTTPAVLSGAGTGQVETRLAMFCLVGAMAAADAVRSGKAADAMLAGAMAGFYAGAKYMGLLFVASAGAAMLINRARWRMAFTFAVAAAIAGFQWYWWNWLHTGDPVFPALFRLLGLPDSAIWMAAHDRWFRTSYFAIEVPIARDIANFLTFPLFALLDPPPVIEAGRTGFGPLPLLIAPFAAAGLWRFRHHVLRSPLAVAGLIAGGFYLLWFWSGISQRIRHLLPIYPIVLLCLVVLAQRWSARNRTGHILAAAAGLSIAIQIGGQGIQSVNFFRYAAQGESRDAFLMRNLSGYPAVQWINAHLGRNEKVLVTERELVYAIDVPVFLAHSDLQTQVELSPLANDPARFARQVRALGITHFLLARGVDAAGNIATESPKAARIERFANALRHANCLDLAAVFPSRRISSRALTTIGIWPTSTGYGAVYRLRETPCSP